MIAPPRQFVESDVAREEMEARPNNIVALACESSLDVGHECAKSFTLYDRA